MTATVPSVPAQPATPGQALRWAADRLNGVPATLTADTLLRRWADELDAAPAVYTLPAEPPATVTELWDRNGQRWERWETGDYVRWSHTAWPRRNCTWHELLVYGPLSTAPPAGTEGA